MFKNSTVFYSLKWPNIILGNKAEPFHNLQLMLFLCRYFTKVNSFAWSLFINIHPKFETCIRQLCPCSSYKRGIYLFAYIFFTSKYQTSRLLKELLTDEAFVLTEKLLIANLCLPLDFQSTNLKNDFGFIMRLFKKR